MSRVAVIEPVYALLTNGATIAIRQIRPDDVTTVRDLHRLMSPENQYLRFFGFGPSLADEAAERIASIPERGIHSGRQKLYEYQETT